MTLVAERIPQILRPRQLEAVDAVIASLERAEKPICAMATGMGKALSVATRVLTPSGYKLMGELRVGDQVIGQNGLATTVVGVFPQGVRPAYKVTFSDSTSTVCDENHLWAVRTRFDKYHSQHRGGGAFRVLSTADLIASNLRAGHGDRWFIPTCQPIEFTSSPVPLDAYLLGLLIGDGYLGSGLPTISTSDSEILDSVAEVLPANVHLKHRGAYDWSLTSQGTRRNRNPLVLILEGLGLWGKVSQTKFIPDVYLFNDLPTRIALLQGLMDTDGYADAKSNHCSYCTTSPELANNVAFLVQSLGGIAIIRNKHTKKQLAYNVTIVLPNQVAPFRLQRKMERLKPRTKYFPTRSISQIDRVEDQEMICIAVDAPDSLYVIEHGIVTHNTTVIAETLVRLIDPHQHRALVVAHTQEIIFQLFERIANQYGGALDGYFGFLKPGIGIVMGDRDAMDARIVIATRQSLHKKRLMKLLQHGDFNLLIIDECHHASGDNTYAAIIDTLETACPRLKRFGTTATPFRGDGVGLISLWTNICYEFLLPDAVKAGELAPPVRVPVATRVDASSIKTRQGDYVPSELVSALEAENWLDLCLAAFEEHITPDHLTMAFMPTVAMSRQLVAGLNAAGRPAAHVDGTTPDNERADALKALKGREITTLSNFGIYLEGADVPAVNAIFLGRPTRSRTLITQIIGRGVRKEEGKTHCLIVDMTVMDTKAVEFGSLLGRMVNCRNCGSEIHSFLKVCPACGTERVRGSRRAGGGGGGKAAPQFSGRGLVASAHLPLFANTYAAWHIGPDGFSCMISFDGGTFVIVPPEDDEYWRLYHVPDSQRDRIEFKDRSDDAKALVKIADDYARQNGGAQCDRKAKWRTPPASESQLAMLRKEGIKGDFTKGEASALIAHHKAMTRLLPELERRASVEPHWIIEMQRTGQGDADRARLWRVIDRLTATSGYERVKILVKGGDAKWGTSERPLPNVRTLIDETMVAYLESEAMVVYPE